MKIALGIEYDGSRYHGWQRQKKTTETIQEKVEQSLFIVADHPVTIVCAGRTDARVHAFEQVVHFETDKHRTEYQWVRGINSNLPADICVIWMKEVCDEFHARYSAAARYYRYEILNRWVKSALSRDHVTTIFQRLDEERMQAGANYLVGKHDFTSFRAQGCQGKSPIKTIHSVKINRLDDKISVDIIANAFLHHMVRNIVGTLLPVGHGEASPGWVEEVLAAKDRCKAGVTARPNGLYFKGAYYPRRFGIKTHPDFLLFEHAIEAPIESKGLLPE
ncbi:MAG: tRNA pseudouridine(38,39,40) synthase TruA [Cycloclasticus sp. symbiont of Poecilosclerida sp. M]|nr:MAG: tRNA pseudouridine(38,39,40) synthase TruA [Cycloclasticus sp. symbiont of Poecilosclerida sp. M]